MLIVNDISAESLGSLVSLIAKRRVPRLVSIILVLGSKGRHWKETLGSFFRKISLLRCVNDDHFGCWPSLALTYTVPGPKHPSSMACSPPGCSFARHPTLHIVESLFLERSCHFGMMANHPRFCDGRCFLVWRQERPPPLSITYSMGNVVGRLHTAVVVAGQLKPIPLPH